MEQDKENVSIIILDTDLVSFGLWLVRHVEKNQSALKLQGLYPPHWLSFNPQEFDPWEYAQNFSLSFSFNSVLSTPDKPRTIRCEIARREHRGFQVKITSSIQMDRFYLDQLSNAIKQHWQDELIEAESATPTSSLEESSLLLLKRLYNKVEASTDIAVSAFELVNNTSAQDKTSQAIFYLVGEGWAKFGSGTRDVRITKSGIEKIRSSFPNPEPYHSPNTSIPPAQSCANCHFLMKQVDGRPFEVSLQNRESIHNQDYSWLHSHYSLGCYRAVWDEGYNFEIGRRHEVIVLTNRENDCFFWLYKPGMLFPAAVELQKGEAEKLSNIQLPRDSAITVKEMVSDTGNITVDIVILTALPEEYQAVCSRLTNSRQAPGSLSNPNLYAWELGEILHQETGRPYSVAVGMTGRAGTSDSALATQNAISQWKPRYVFFVGIAGGLGSLEKGNVVVARLIHGYEYGKLDDKQFIPRNDWTYHTDQALVTNAMAFIVRNPDWIKNIEIPSPEESQPQALIGEIASGDKVVDDPDMEFFQSVIRTWPKLEAVEMEGVGVSKAIEQAQSIGIPVGFLMIRGISDKPRFNTEAEIRGTLERDTWKVYAANVAAAFTISFIANRMPIAPRDVEESTKDLLARSPVLLPNLILKIFQMDRSRTPQDQITFNQTVGPFPKRFLFGLRLENTTASTIAREIYIRVTFSWRGEIPRGAPIFEAPQGSSGWNTEARKLLNEREAVLTFQGLGIPSGHPRGWDNFQLTLPERMKGYFLIQYHITSIDPQVESSGALRINLA